MKRAILVLALLSAAACYADASDPKRVTITTQDTSGGLGPLLDDYRGVTGLLHVKRQQLKDLEAELTGLPGAIVPLPQDPTKAAEVFLKAVALQADITQTRTDIVRLEARRDDLMERVLALDAMPAHPSLEARRQQVRQDKIVVALEKLIEDLEQQERRQPPPPLRRGCVIFRPDLGQPRPAGSDR